MKEIINNQENGENMFAVEPWKKEDIDGLYDQLELPNWAPWLKAEKPSLSGRVDVFPEGQLLMKDGLGNMIASLSLNQIIWDGNVNTLPTWDDVAGDPTDYSKTYNPEGNTLVLLSMNVSPDQKGKRLPSQMIDAGIQLAHSIGVEHLIGSFRPSDFGKLKKGMGWEMDFWEYCQIKRHSSSKPLDGWLGSLWHKGMEMLVEDPKAMQVSVSLEELSEYAHSYNPNDWVEVSPGIWECGEVGNWKVDVLSNTATYIESNVWGKLPLHK